MRAARLVVVAAILSLACAGCGGSPNLASESASQILARVATDVTAAAAHDAVVSVVVATPTTTLYQSEDAEGNVSGKMVTPDGQFSAVRVVAGDVLSLKYTARFIELSAPRSVRVDAAALRTVATALRAKWMSGAALHVDPAAATFATNAFIDSPLTDERALFGAPAGATVSVGKVSTFDGTKVVPLTVGSAGTVLFVSDTGTPLPVGASVPLGGNTSPTIFTFQWVPGSNARAPIYTTPTSLRACTLWRSVASVRSVLTALAAVGTYARC